MSFDHRGRRLRVELPARPYPGLRPFDQEGVAHLLWPRADDRRRRRAADPTAAARRARRLRLWKELAHSRRCAAAAGTGFGPQWWAVAHVRDHAGGRAAREPRQGPRRRSPRPTTQIDERRLKVSRLLNSGREGAGQLARYVCGERRAVRLLLIDQFEEIFAHARAPRPAAGEPAHRSLIGMQQLKAPKLFIVLTMRSEFRRLRAVRGIPRRGQRDTVSVAAYGACRSVPRHSRACDALRRRDCARTSPSGSSSRRAEARIRCR